MAAMFEHLVPVRWRDTDALGHVNHAVFLTYLEEGRDAFYVQAFGSDPSYVVVRLEVDLRAEVRHLDQQVMVRIRAERMGTTSLTTRETILTSSGEVVADARVVTVRWDPSRRQPIPFSQSERTRLAAVLPTTGSEHELLAGSSQDAELHRRAGNRRRDAHERPEGRHGEIRGQAAGAHGWPSLPLPPGEAGKANSAVAPWQCGS